MGIPAVEAEEALQVLAAHDLDLLPVANPAMRDSPYARTKVFWILSYVHRASKGKKRLVGGSMNRHYLSGTLESYFYSMQVRQLRVHPFPSAASADKGLSPFKNFRLVPASNQTKHFSGPSVYVLRRKLRS